MKIICKTKHSIAIKMFVDLIEDCTLREKIAFDNAIALAKHLQASEREYWKKLRQQLKIEGFELTGEHINFNSKKGVIFEIEKEEN